MTENQKDENKVEDRFQMINEYRQFNFLPKIEKLLYVKEFRNKMGSLIKEPTSADLKETGYNFELNISIVLI